MRCAAWRDRRSCSPSIAARRSSEASPMATMPQPGERPIPRRALAALGKPVGRGLSVLRALTRWDEWYDQKLPMFLAAICYAAIIRDRGADTGAWQIVTLLVLFCLYAAFGHLVND